MIFKMIIPYFMQITYTGTCLGEIIRVCDLYKYYHYQPGYYIFYCNDVLDNLPFIPSRLVTVWVTLSPARCKQQQKECLLQCISMNLAKYLLWHVNVDLCSMHTYRWPVDRPMASRQLAISPMACIGRCALISRPDSTVCGKLTNHS